MKFENTKVFGFENAIVGIRLPMSKDYNDALSKSDSFEDENGNYIIGPNDTKLIKTLMSADISGGHGKPNAKFLRMIHVQVAITAPLSFWKEWDTYKVATVSNSTSTMHKIQSYEITKDCFELKPNGRISNYIIVDDLESLRKKYLETKDKDVWYDLIYGLNDSWLQIRMCDLNYSTLSDMVHWRQNHKQNCWSGKDNPEMENFYNWCKKLPYFDLLISQKECESVKIDKDAILKLKEDIDNIDKKFSSNNTNLYHVVKDKFDDFKKDFEKFYNEAVK